MMDIYSKKNTWKVVLAILGIIILLITTFYSNFLAKQLAVKEEQSAYYFGLAIEEVLRVESDADLQKEIPPLIDSIIFANEVPIILLGEDGMYQGFNYRNDYESDQDFLKAEVEKLLNNGFEPIILGTGYAQEIYYKNSRLYTIIKFFPLVQILLISAFVALGYFLFSTARRAEQNRVWAGMAKETAHQLGTPISAIIAWIEHLKESEVSTDQLDLIHELRSDVRRLELIADRFSKIGSAPKLEKISLPAVLNACRQYMEKRASSKIKFQFPEAGDGPPYVMINEHLFEWVIENLLRNALDAMDNVGVIEARLYSENDYVCVDIRDTGKGIPSSKFKTVFQPGFSTKQRGWGLGLSLAKRIIENYHKGKIFVKSSKINEETTFTIKLPKI